MQFSLGETWASLGSARADCAMTVFWFLGSLFFWWLFFDVSDISRFYHFVFSLIFFANRLYGPSLVCFLGGRTRGS